MRNVNRIKPRQTCSSVWEGNKRRMTSSCFAFKCHKYFILDWAKFWKPWGVRKGCAVIHFICTGTINKGGPNLAMKYLKLFELNIRTQWKLAPDHSGGGQMARVPQWAINSESSRRFAITSLEPHWSKISSAQLPGISPNNYLSLSLVTSRALHTLPFYPGLDFLSVVLVPLLSHSPSSLKWLFQIRTTWSLSAQVK